MLTLLFYAYFYFQLKIAKYKMLNVDISRDKRSNLKLIIVSYDI